MKKIVNIIKSECVLLISAVLAVISSVFVTPDREYISYIDFRTLALLFCLMLTVAGFSEMGLFSFLAQKLMQKAKSTRSLSLLLSLMCFFLSMLITNDVALITFVPFTIITLKKAGRTDRLFWTVSLETVAANLGSMLTPIGNPQNLYIFSAYNLSGKEFLSAVVPNAALSLVLVVVCALIPRKQNISNSGECEKLKMNPVQTAVFSVIFIAALLSVFRVLDYRILFAVSVVLVLIFNINLLKKVDYSLLFTFVFLFIFIGNLGRIEQIGNILKSTVGGHEIASGIIISQIFSNVPTAILLSGFTDNAKALLTGVNLGGLGTLIASMASLISFKLIQKEKANSGRYLAVFTLMNIAFLAVNVLYVLIF